MVTETVMTFDKVFDIGAALVLAYFVVRGAMRGLTGEIVSLLGLIASVLCSWTFARPLSIAAQNYFAALSPTVLELACAIAIFIGVSLAFAVVSKIVKALVKAANLTFLDHAMGAVSGCVRTFVVVLFIYGVASIFSTYIPSDWMKNSLAMKGASVVWPVVFKVMTDNGWIDPSQLTPKIEALPNYLNVNPAQSDT